MAKSAAIDDLLKVMARLRSPKGCPWDREQDHLSLRWHAVEEVYGLIEASKSKAKRRKAEWGRELFELAKYAKQQGWSAEGLLRAEIKRNERGLRKTEKPARASRKAG